MVWVKRLTLLAGALIVVVVLWTYQRLTGSLPALEGDVVLSGLTASSTIDRDELGVATIRAQSRLDAARTLGFVHAQERFFQMDLSRRRAAGELSELVGSGALALDERHRKHRMRARAQRTVSTSSASDRALLDAYRDGVNGGLDALDAPPFEYLLLRQ